ncbi:hypothetical protein BH18ACT5_BH18ACT5_15850 [soil metagenome]
MIPLDIDAEKAIAATLSRFAILLAADTVGACDAMLAMAVEYSKQRKQFGVPIGSFQAVQHAAAEMLAKIEPVRSVVYLAAAEYDAKPGSCCLPPSPKPKPRWLGWRWRNRLSPSTERSASLGSTISSCSTSA